MFHAAIDTLVDKFRLCFAEQVLAMIGTDTVIEEYPKY